MASTELMPPKLRPKEEAIELAKVEMETVYLNKPHYLCVSDGFVSHWAGINEDNECCVGWWLEYKEHKRSCPCWVFHLSKLEDEETFFGDKYERILIEWW